jgi:hypothetical protein
MHETKPRENKMKITRRQLRKIMRQNTLNEGVLMVTRGPYGMFIEDNAGEYITIGDMVLALLAAGDDASLFPSHYRNLIRSMLKRFRAVCSDGTPKYSKNIITLITTGYCAFMQS